MPNRSNSPRLTRDIHLRIDENLERLIAEVAAQNCIPQSTLCRIVLMRTLPQYTRNRFFG
jgi:hypothetical protein